MGLSFSPNSSSDKPSKGLKEELSSCQIKLIKNLFDEIFQHFFSQATIWPPRKKLNRLNVWKSETRDFCFDDICSK